MNLRDLLRSLARRWYVVLAGLIVTAVAGIALAGVIPVAYVSQASVVLLPPRSPSDPEANPYLRLGGLSQAVDILTRTINSDAYSAPLLKQNPGATFTTAADTTTSGPIILIESRAPTPARATAMTESALTSVPIVLDDIQNRLSVKPDARIGETTIAVDQKPKLDAKIRIQVVVGAVALGVVLSILLAGLIDGLALSRRRRIAAESEPDEPDERDERDRVSAPGLPASTSLPPGTTATSRPAARPAAKERLAQPSPSSRD